MFCIFLAHLNRLWEVCRDVQIEPTFLEITENKFERKGNTADKARLGFSAIGLWNSYEKTLFDIKSQILSHSLILITLLQIYQQHEKKRRINTTKERLALRISHSFPLFSQVLGWHQTVPRWTKDGPSGSQTFEYHGPFDDLADSCGPL